MKFITCKHMVFVFCVLTFLVVSYTALTHSQSLVAFCVVLLFTSFFLFAITLDNKTILFDFRDDNPRYTKDDLEKHMLKGFEEGYKKGQEEANG